MIAQL